MALIIGLTGGVGSGKSSVSAIFQELGAAVVDTDEIAHQLTAPGQPGARAIGLQFGAEYLRSDGALDRDRMRELVFGDPIAKQKLEAILHPMIRTEVNAKIRAALEDARSPYVVVVVPLLIETGAYRDLIQRTLVVDCDEKQQTARVMRRDRLSAAQVQRIVANQTSRAQRLEQADDIVHNDGDLLKLRADVEALDRQYRALAGTAKSRP